MFNLSKNKVYEADDHFSPDKTLEKLKMSNAMIQEKLDEIEERSSEKPSSKTDSGKIVIVREEEEESMTNLAENEIRRLPGYRAPLVIPEEGETESESSSIPD